MRRAPIEVQIEEIAFEGFDQGAAATAAAALPGELSRRLTGGGPRTPAPDAVAAAIAREVAARVPR
jgi:hypothetical protein